MLFTVADGEVVDVDVLIGELEFRGFYFPWGLVDEHPRMVHADMGGLAILFIQQEICGGGYHAAEFLLATMVVEGNVGG